MEYFRLVFVRARSGARLLAGEAASRATFVFKWVSKLHVACVVKLKRKAGKSPSFAFTPMQLFAV